MTGKPKTILVILIFVIVLTSIFTVLYVLIPKSGDLRLKTVSTKSVIEVYECSYAGCGWKEYND